MPIVKASFNHNDYIQFRLTEASARLINEDRTNTYERLREAGFDDPAALPTVHAGDLHKMQFWAFCQVLGPYMVLGGPAMVHDGQIEVVS